MLAAIRCRWALVIAISLTKAVSLISESLESVSTLLRFVGARMLKFAVV